MANGVSFTEAQAYKDFVEEFANELYSDIFFGFSTANIAMAHEGVKGKKVLTELMLADNLATRWAAPYVGTANTSYLPEVLEVVTNKVEHSVIPQEFESSYLGMMRRQGQSSDDYPFQAYVLGKLIEKLASEMEVAFWQGEAAAVPATSDLLRETFDGILKQVADKIVATDLTPVATGVSTAANIIANMRTMWAQVSTVDKNSGMDIYVSYVDYDLIRIAFKDTYKVDIAYTEINSSDYEGMFFELGGRNTRIIPVPGMGTSRRIIMHRPGNLHYGMDALGEWANFDFEKNHRQLDFWNDFNFGVLGTQLRDGIAVVNDQA